jgi:hypothetical protein
MLRRLQGDEIGGYEDRRMKDEVKHERAAAKTMFVPAGSKRGARGKADRAPPDA